jgi:hypothetical protein
MSASRSVGKQRTFIVSLRFPAMQSCAFHGVSARPSRIEGGLACGPLISFDSSFFC